MGETKEITPIQYAKYIGWWPSYVQRLLRQERYDKLPHIIKVRKYSRFYTLEVPATLTQADFIETPVIQTNKKSKK